MAIFLEGKITGHKVENWLRARSGYNVGAKFANGLEAEEEAAIFPQYSLVASHIASHHYYKFSMIGVSVV